MWPEGRGLVLEAEMGANKCFLSRPELRSWVVQLACQSYCALRPPCLAEEEPGAQSGWVTPYSFPSSIQPAVSTQVCPRVLAP